MGIIASDGTRVLDSINLEVAQGELLVLVGQSGSGKTSVIRAIAGFEKVTSGAVLFDEVDFTNVPVGERDVGMVFQTAALFPGETARGNISFPLRIRKLRGPTVRERVAAEARALGITQILERWPNQLSAGHQQLVQIARAMVRVPSVLLLDEPMAHVDPPTRNRLRRDLRELQQGYGVTTVLATNDPDEAMRMADRIAAIENGHIRQVGTPAELYAAPADIHIAWLTGPISLIGATIEIERPGYWVVAEGFRMRAWAPELEHHVGESIHIGIRPEGIRVLPSSQIRATVEGMSFESGSPVTRVSVGGVAVAMAAVDEPAGSDLGVAIDRYFIFDSTGRLVASVG